MFFFCKQKPAYEMRMSDWSSDVCSSDLLAEAAVDQRQPALPPRTLLADTAQFPGEIEAAVDERLRQIGRRIVGDMEILPQLQRVERRSGVKRRQVDRKSTRLNSSH